MKKLYGDVQAVLTGACLVVGGFLLTLVVISIIFGGR
jgi:hypothetical protein